MPVPSYAYDASAMPLLGRRTAARSGAVINPLRRTKEVRDPTGIVNPGKLRV